MNKSHCGRRYEREFKNNAVALVRSGRKISEVSRDLGGAALMLSSAF